MPYKYRDLMWSEMTDKQKGIAGSKSEHKAAKEAYNQRQETPTPTPAPAPSPTPTPSASTAVERSQSWADLNKDERKELQTADPDVTKKSYNKSTGYRAEEVAIQKQDADPLNTKYSEMSDTYKANVDKSTHKGDRKSSGTYTNDKMEAKQDTTPDRITRSELKDQLSGQRSLQEMQELQESGQVTGDKAQEYLDRRIEKLKGKIYTGDVEDFDGTRGGAGSKKGYDRLSKSDLKGLVEGGMSKEEAYNYAMSGDHGHDVSGEKAQKLLGKWKNEFTNNPPPEETQPDPVEPDPVEPDPVEPTPSDPVEPTPTPTDPVVPAPTPTVPAPTPTTPAPTPTPGQPIVTGPINQENDQRIVNDDVNNTTIEDSFNGGTIGDISQGGTINGNNNTINNTVDNSNNSRYYGGDNTVWNINNSNQSANTGFALGGGNYTGGVTSPLSNLTMMGYGKPSDSPSANAPVY